MLKVLTSSCRNTGMRAATVSIVSGLAARIISLMASNALICSRQVSEATTSGRWLASSSAVMISLAKGDSGELVTLSAESKERGQNRVCRAGSVSWR
jgi:hypothetical protein